MGVDIESRSRKMCRDEVMTAFFACNTKCRVDQPRRWMRLAGASCGWRGVAVDTIKIGWSCLSADSA